MYVHNLKKHILEFYLFKIAFYNSLWKLNKKGSKLKHTVFNSLCRVNIRGNKI